MDQARREALTFWKAAGIEWESPGSFRKRTLSARGVNKMPRDCKDLRSIRGSSGQSLRRKTGNIEAEQLNGDIVRLGKLLGILIPFNKVLIDRSKVAEEMATQKEQPGKYTPEQLMEIAKRTVH